ncbi:MAG: hypothetical protein GY777_11235 [Candidatus Brocadiaceae bacterium]|nr:hypothetical protein [Candidatus Brocadiaceae bacterium]
MTNICDYFIELQQIVCNLSGVEVEKYEEQVLTEKRGNMRIRLRFSDNSLLELSEAIRITGNTLQQISYRYHYQTSVGKTIFRYDDAPHHPKIKTYPHHKHIFDKVLECSHPDIETVINEVKEYLTKQDDI